MAFTKNINVPHCYFLCQKHTRQKEITPSKITKQANKIFSNLNCKWIARKQQMPETKKAGIPTANKAVKSINFFDKKTITQITDKHKKQITFVDWQTTCPSPNTRDKKGTKIVPPPIPIPAKTPEITPPNTKRKIRINFIYFHAKSHNFNYFWLILRFL